MSLWSAAYNLFFFFECYHFMTHMCVLFRVRLLPRKDLVRNRYYFLIDTTCVFIVNFLLVQRLQLIAFLQICQHLYYFFTWEKSNLAKKVRPGTTASFSWTQTDDNRWSVSYSIRLYHGVAWSGRSCHDRSLCTKACLRLSAPFLTRWSTLSTLIYSPVTCRQWKLFLASLWCTSAYRSYSSTPGISIFIKHQCGA